VTPGTAPGSAGGFPADGAVAVERSLTWVEGPDAEGFLHGLLSNDILSLAPGHDRAALLLDAKGHIVASVVVHRDAADAFTLITEPHLGVALTDALNRYHFSEDLEVLGPEPATGLVVAAGGPEPPGADMVVDGWVPGTREVLMSDPGAARAALGLREVPEHVLEGARIAAGSARVGVDTAPTTLVQEAGLEDVAVSFQKGCYLGQETVARAEFRGKVNRVLRIVHMGTPPATLPAPVVAGDRQVGSLTSVAPDGDGHIGLAILRREVEPGSEVMVGDGGASALVRAVPARATTGERD
jgi:tRNA-modifying protein YgfZ